MIPGEEGEKEYYVPDTSDTHLICTYTLMPFPEIMELDCITYRMLFKDAYIHHLSQSEEGREYLENCWMLKQTEPDKGALRENFGG